MAYGITYVSPVDVTPTWVTEDQWFTTDVSAYVPAGAIAAVLEVGCPAVESYVGWRKPGSTDTHIMSQEDRSHVLAIVGLDSNRQFELWLDNDNFEVFIVGYIPAGAGEIETNWIDKSTATTVTWVEIDLSSNITGGVGAAAIMRIKNTDGAATYDIGVRSTDSTDEEFYRSWRAQTATSLLTGLDSTEKCEQKIENVPMDIWYCGAIYSGYISMQNTPTDYSTTTRGSWVDTALSAMSEGSKMAIILGHATAAERSLRVRRDGDTWDFSAAVYGDMIYALYMVVGTDSAKEIEQWCEDLSNYPELFLIGEALDGGATQRQFSSTIAAASSTAAIDLAVKRPLASAVAAASTTSGIDLIIAGLIQFASAIAVASSAAAIDLQVKRPLSSAIAASSTVAAIDLLIGELIQFASTIAAGSTTGAIDLAVQRRLISSIEAASDAAGLDLKVTRQLVSSLAAASSVAAIDLLLGALGEILNPSIESTSVARSMTSKTTGRTIEATTPIRKIESAPE